MVPMELKSLATADILGEGPRGELRIRGRSGSLFTADVDRENLALFKAAITIDVAVPVDRPPNLSRKEIQHYAAVDLALARWMLGDIGQPQLVGLEAVKDPLHKVLTRGDVLQILEALLRPRQALNASSRMILGISFLLTISPCSISSEARSAAGHRCHGERA